QALGQLGIELRVDIAVVERRDAAAARAHEVEDEALERGLLARRWSGRSGHRGLLGGRSAHTRTHGPASLGLLGRGARLGAASGRLLRVQFFSSVGSNAFCSSCSCKYRLRAWVSRVANSV